MQVIDQYPLQQFDLSPSAQANPYPYPVIAHVQVNDLVIDQYLLEQSDLPASVQAELAVKHETVNPWWWGIKVLVKYRTSRNYRDPAFIGQRIGDKVVLSLLILTLYWGIGDDFRPGNYINISAVRVAGWITKLVLTRSQFCGLSLVCAYACAQLHQPSRWKV